MGVTLETRIHSSRFKKCLLSQFEDISAYNEGKEVILVFNYDIGEAITTAANINYDDDGYILAKAANIIRRDILGMKNENFNGKFNNGCQESSIPVSSQRLISAVMRGTSSETNNNEHFKQAALTVNQLLTFNTTIRTQKESSSVYHSKEREPPLPIYLAQMIHSKTRNLSIVKTLSKLGLCISKHRLEQISTAMGNAVIDMNEREGVVLPMSLKIGLFIHHRSIILMYQPSLPQPSLLFMEQLAQSTNTLAMEMKVKLEASLNRYLMIIS